MDELLFGVEIEFQTYRLLLVELDNVLKTRMNEYDDVVVIVFSVIYFELFLNNFFRNQQTNKQTTQSCNLRRWRINYIALTEQWLMIPVTV